LPQVPPNFVVEPETDHENFKLLIKNLTGSTKNGRFGMRSKQLNKNCPKHLVIEKISRLLGNRAQASNFQPEVDMWPFLSMRSK